MTSNGIGRRGFLGALAACAGSCVIHPSITPASVATLSGKAEAATVGLAAGGTLNAAQSAKFINFVCNEEYLIGIISERAARDITWSNQDG